MALPALSGIARAGSWVIGQSGRLRLRIDFTGPDLAKMFDRFGPAFSDFRELWINDVAPMFFDDVQQNIATQGGLVGGWRALSPKYAAWKRRHYGHERIMVLTSALRESLKIGGPGNIVQATRRQMFLGSRDPKLPYHQRGTNRMPQRIVLVWLGDRRYGRALGTFVKQKAIEAGFPNVRLRSNAGTLPARVLTRGRSGR